MYVAITRIEIRNEYGEILMFAHRNGKKERNFPGSYLFNTNKKCFILGRKGVGDRERKPPLILKGCDP